MIQALKKETIMVFNGNNKLVMEALGIPLQNHKQVETISEKDLYEETFLK